MAGFCGNAMGKGVSWRGEVARGALQDDACDSYSRGRHVAFDFHLPLRASPTLSTDFQSTYRAGPWGCSYHLTTSPAYYLPHLRQHVMLQNKPSQHATRLAALAALWGGASSASWAEPVSACPSPAVVCIMHVNVCAQSGEALFGVRQSAEALLRARWARFWWARWAR